MRQRPSLAAAASAAAVVVLLSSTAAIAAETSGALPSWRQSAVAVVDGDARELLLADLDGDGRSEVLLLDTRRARLTVLRFAPAAATSARRDGNEPPMARGFVRFAVPLPPLAAAMAVVPGATAARVLVATNRARVAEVAISGTAGRVVAERDLLRSDLTMIAPVALPLGRSWRMVLATRDGLQAIDPDGRARPMWLTPQEATIPDRLAVGDLDGDGVADLVQFDASDRGAALRWRRVRGEVIEPAQPLTDRSLRDAVVLRQGAAAAAVAAIPAEARDQVQLARLASEGEGAFGRRDELPRLGQAPIASLMLDDGPALVVADRSAPQFLVLPLRGDGVSGMRTFPAVPRIAAIAAAGDGRLLIQVEGDAPLHESRWRDGRLTYPQPLGATIAVEAKPVDRRLLGLGRVAGRTWTAARRGADLVLELDGREAVVAGAGAKAVRAQWIGGDRVLVMDQFARHPRLRSASGADREMAGMDLAAIRLVPSATGVEVVRLDDGVVQRLDDDLRPIDQIMLGDGQRIADVVGEAPGRLLALEAGGRRLHRLAPDAAGVWRPGESWPLAGGDALQLDERAGLLVRHGERLLRLAPGRSPRLAAAAAVDLVALDPVATRGRADRLMAVDLDGDGRDEVAVIDDAAHRIAVAKVVGDALAPMAAWPLFDDSKYPYGGEDPRRSSREPRAIAAGDLDGDGRRDLAILVHDRVLMYLTKGAP